MPPEEANDLVRLNMASSISLLTYQTLLEHFGSVGAILKARKADLLRIPKIGEATARNIAQARRHNVGKEKELARKLGIEIITYHDDAYPANLKAIHDPPLVLYVKGKVEENDRLALAMVGARRCSYYGRKQAERLAGQLARLGITVVSGMARGIDTCCHQGALGAGGRTIAVLGNGLASIYPPENEKLFDQIVACGAVISELPLEAPPLAQHFPRRNRLISGLSLGALVVEASARSGSLITARWALEQGKEVFAVPGKIDSPHSKGCHRLIKDGAKLVEDVNDILDELGELGQMLKTESTEEVEAGPELPLNPEEKQVFRLLSTDPKHIDDIAAETGYASAKVSSILVSLELKKIVTQLPGNQFVRT